MATTRKTLGQLFPISATYTKLYTVPASTDTVISTMTICNQSTTATSFRVAVRVGGVADSTKDKIYFDCPIGSNGTFAFTFGMTLSASDEIWVYATLGTLSFNLFGQENS